MTNPTEPTIQSPSPDVATLLVSCPDRRGIVAALAQVLHGHGANILESDQYTDPVAAMFFQRIHFDAVDLLTDRATLERAIAEVAARLSMGWRVAWSDHTKRMAIFVSRTNHCLYDLLLRHQAGELRCEIPLIVSNHADFGPVAAQFGIPYHVFAIGESNKAEQEKRELALLAEQRIDLVVLARYMQVLGDTFATRLYGQIINIHHSFLPSFKGAKPYHQAHERGVKIIGATAHYVTPDLDEGPIIEQETARVTHAMTPDDLIAVGRDTESRVLARAVKLHLESRVMLNGRKTVVFG